MRDGLYLWENDFGNKSQTLDVARQRGPGTGHSWGTAGRLGAEESGTVCELSHRHMKEAAGERKHPLNQDKCV